MAANQRLTPERMTNGSTPIAVPAELSIRFTPFYIHMKKDSEDSASVVPNFKRKFGWV